MDDVYDALKKLRAEGGAAALVTVVDVSGSTYRRQGAKMIITDQDEAVGTISGGCLEHDVTQMAHEAMDQGEPLRKVYDMTADDDDVWGLGLGCNGTVEVFVEPIGAEQQEAAADG